MTDECMVRLCEGWVSYVGVCVCVSCVVVCGSCVVVCGRVGVCVVSGVYQWGSE